MDQSATLARSCDGSGAAGAHAIDSIRYQVDINNLTQREVENLPLNGIGLVALTFDEPLVLDRYQQNPVTGGLIFINKLV